LAPELIKRHGADALLCQGIGRKAIDLCGQLGIKVYVGQADTVEKIYKLWHSRKLNQASAADACK
jgi:predicted Fe-Mo cluster-binding NifX family protein